jgi:hypothetical protein
MKYLSDITVINEMESIKIDRDYGSVSLRLVINFEVARNFLLPKIYKELLTKHNGLKPENDSFKFKNIYADEYSWSYKIEDGSDSREISFFGFGDDIPDHKKISSQDFDIYGHDQIIAFGSSANGDYICFDYRHAPTTDEPRVVLMFHDTYDKNNKMLICPIANSFEEFMDSLYKPED